MLASGVAQSSTSRGIKREIEDDDDGWMRPSKRFLIDETLEMDEEDVFTVGGGGMEPEHGYAIRPPPIPAVTGAPSASPALNFALALNPVTVPMSATVAEPLAILTPTTLDTLMPTVPTVATSAPVLDSVVPIAAPTVATSAPILDSVAPTAAPTVVTSAPALESLVPTAAVTSTPVATVTPIADPLIATVPTLSPISGPTLALVPSATQGPPLIPNPTPLDTARLRSLDEFNTSLLPDLHNLMETLRWGCPSHYLLGINDPWEHRAGSCSMDKCNNRDAGWKSWRRFFFRENICWGCGVERDVSSSFHRSSASLT